MKFATIKSSELGNRWDASFHFARLEAREAAACLAEDPSLTPDRILETISAFPSAVWQSLVPLLRRDSDRIVYKRDLPALVREYPFIALGLVVTNSSTLIHDIREAQEEARTQIAKSERTIEALSSLSQRVASRPKTR